MAAERSRCPTRRCPALHLPRWRSRSPAIHNAALQEAGLNAVYVPLLVDDMPSFLSTFTGAWSGLGWEQACVGSAPCQGCMPCSTAPTAHAAPYLAPRVPSRRRRGLGRVQRDHPSQAGGAGGGG